MGQDQQAKGWWMREVNKKGYREEKEDKKGKDEEAGNQS